MATFAVVYEYGPDTETRMNARPEHRAWQKRLNEAGVLLASGPLESVDQPGGLLIFRADDQANVEDLLAQDPYAEIGVIASTQVRPWNPVFGPVAEA